MFENTRPNIPMRWNEMADVLTKNENELSKM